MRLEPIENSLLHREPELANQAQLREERRALFTQELRERRIRLELERRERETKLVNGSLRERLLMGMTVICFLCTIGLLIVGSQTGQPYVLGSSGAFGVVSTLFFRLLRSG
ncbi:MAG TPA: hypothetical protein VD741_09635 [Solirubrobacterales bacterium]|nr:hypothetical protein [Solirubrobacterales bacterium]